jgi:hypothetical protein
MANAAEVYYEKYGPQMELLEGSLLAKARGIESHDVYAVGKMLEQFDEYVQVVNEEDGNANLLGKIPTIAHDVITVSYGTSVIPFIAQTQPIDDENGLVYFLNVRAGTTKGDTTAGDTFVDPKTGVTTPTSYSSNWVSELAYGTTNGITSYTGYSLTQLPIRKGSLRVKLTSSSNAAGYDDQDGNIVGVDYTGASSVNYTTGAVTVVLAANPDNNDGITIEYQVNYELATDIPAIDSFFDSTQVTARVYALKGVTGMLQSYGMRKRFGMVAEDILAKNIVAQINAEIGGDLIGKLNTGAQGTTSWDKTPPAAAISYFEHKQTFKDSISDAEVVMMGNAGRGTITTMIVGRAIAGVISTLPGWNKLTDGNTVGPHVYGTFDGITIIRVPDTNILGASTAICMWKPNSPFEGPAVYAPFMPLVSTGTLPMANPLKTQKAAAVWAAVDVLVGNFATKLTMTEST